MNLARQYTRRAVTFRDPYYHVKLRYVPTTMSIPLASFWKYSDRHKASVCLAQRVDRAGRPWGVRVYPVNFKDCQPYKTRRWT